MTDGPEEHDLELTVSALKEGVLDLGIPGGLVELGNLLVREGRTPPK